MGIVLMRSKKWKKSQVEVDRLLAEEISATLGVPVTEMPTDTDEFMGFFYMFLVGEILSLTYCADMIDRMQRVAQVIADLERILMEM